MTGPSSGCAVMATPQAGTPTITTVRLTALRYMQTGGQPSAMQETPFGWCLPIGGTQPRTSTAETTPGNDRRPRFSQALSSLDIGEMTLLKMTSGSYSE